MDHRHEAGPGFRAKWARYQSRRPVVVKDHQAQMQLKSGRNASYDYAGLSVVLDELVAVLTQCGLLLLMVTFVVDGIVFVAAVVMDEETGEGIASTLPIGPITLAGQQLGISRTYSTRYVALAAGLLSPDPDTDGNGLDGNNQAVTGPKPSRKGKTSKPAMVTESKDDPEALNLRLVNAIGATTTIADLDTLMQHKRTREAFGRFNAIQSGLALNAEATQRGKLAKAGRPATLTQVAATIGGTEAFRTFVSETRGIELADDEAAAEYIRKTCGIDSRAELAAPGADVARSLFASLRAEFDAWRKAPPQ